jgi:hypothetical protein
MSDEQETVDAGSETSGDEAAEPSQEDTADAGDAPGETEESETVVAPDTDQSRTGFVEKGQRAGDECICPDGRKGTVHSFDAGLICIPNHDQG